MFSSKEKEIIERCLSISIWNHRMGKSSMAGKDIEVGIFQEKIKKELLVLKKIVEGYDTLSKFRGLLVEGRKKDTFFQRFFGKMVRGA